jgi:RHS repeat-associated protein
VQAEKLDAQTTDNYQYDEIGNLIKDTKEGITSIEWNVYGKIRSITKGSMTITYTYDAAGNRITKEVDPASGPTRKTYYVRDATGNVMSVYEEGGLVNDGNLTQSEVHLYCSSRLGIFKPDVDMTTLVATDVYGFERGKKFFELSNHLGNVLVSITDRKNGVAQSVDTTLVDYYLPDVASANDYYPFGMTMPGRSAHSDKYRYGFNGKEKDNAINEEGNAYDFGARIYNPGLGKWLSADPLESKYPSLSPYNFVSNSPLNAIDPDGKLIIFINGLWGFPTPVKGGGTEGYWGANWIAQVQNAIGDHKQPIYFDGSLGGTSKLFSGNNCQDNRKKYGKATGYLNGKTIINMLDQDETIKIVTNSMGTAYERGFSEGLVQYIDERVAAIGGELLIAGLQKSSLEKQLSPDRIKELNRSVMVQPQTDIERKYRDISDKIDGLEQEKQKLQKVEIEMVIDLSSHQTDYADPNAKSSYYMTADNNMAPAETLGGLGVQEKHIKGAKRLGQMSFHHAAGANPKLFPKAANPN